MAVLCKSLQGKSGWPHCSSYRLWRVNHVFLLTVISASNVYALSKSGILYVLPAAASSQEENANRSLPKELQKSSGSWVSWIVGGSKPVNGQGNAYAVPMEQSMLKSGER
jgi:hypothetical protein